MIQPAPGKQICNNFRTIFMFIPHNRLFKGTFSNGLKLLIIHCMRNCCNLFIFMCLVLSDMQVRSSLFDERHIFLFSFLVIKKSQILYVLFGTTKEFPSICFCYNWLNHFECATMASASNNIESDV